MGHGLPLTGLLSIWLIAIAGTESGTYSLNFNPDLSFYSYLYESFDPAFLYKETQSRERSTALENPVLCHVIILARSPGW
jgi:hypothetical protein